MSHIRAFHIAIDQSDIDALKLRLQQSKMPTYSPANSWEDGTDVSYMKELMQYWQDEFDWRNIETQLNTFDHYLVDIDGLDMHFIHQRSSHAHAKPLIITHGWPGSVIEFIAIIERLAQPEKWGGNIDDAFHVVCPSLPGFAWSQAAVAPGMNAKAVAERHAKLMALLGYENYLAQGGDWGAVITRQLALIDPNCQAIHLNMVPAYPTEDMLATFAELTAGEQAGLMRTNTFKETGMAYYAVQSSQPQTLAYGLTDSPVGLAAWLVEKFRSWSDCNGDIATAIHPDHLLANISLYWFTNTIASSMRIYREEAIQPSPGNYLDKPTGVGCYPKEIVYIPRTWAEAEYNIVHWSEQEKGGHFAALEQPELFVVDLRKFNSSL